jgi:hypothetical protein
MQTLDNKHPPRSSETTMGYLLRLAEVAMRRIFPPAQLELFGDYELGGIYATQED